MKLPVNYSELTTEERREVRNEYVKLQKGKCHFCHLDLKVEPPQDLEINEDLFPPNFFKYPVHLHHSHDSGMTIGAVHNYCNAVLWEYHNE